MSDHPDDRSYAAKSVGVPETKIRERHQPNPTMPRATVPRAETISRSTRNWLLACLRGRG
jgi:hypothetical protein